MNKLLILLILISFLSVSPALAGEESSVVGMKIESKTLDRRAEVLKAYLSKYNSPLEYHVQDFIEAADIYNLDWKLVPAISGVESTFGKAIPGGYNAWGWGVYGNQAIYFKSWRQGIFTVSQGLRQNYLNRGLTTPYAMNRLYATSPSWGWKVSYFLDDMENFHRQYEMDQNNLVPISKYIQNTNITPIPTPAILGYLQTE